MIRSLKIVFLACILVTGITACGGSSDDSSGGTGATAPAVAKDVSNVIMAVDSSAFSAAPQSTASFAPPSQPNAFTGSADYDNVSSFSQPEILNYTNPKEQITGLFNPDDLTTHSIYGLVYHAEWFARNSYCTDFDSGSGIDTACEIKDFGLDTDTPCFDSADTVTGQSVNLVLFDEPLSGFDCKFDASVYPDSEPTNWQDGDIEITYAAQATEEAVSFFHVKENTYTESGDPNDGSRQYLAMYGAYDETGGDMTVKGFGFMDEAPFDGTFDPGTSDAQVDGRQVFEIIGNATTGDLTRFRYADAWRSLTAVGNLGTAMIVGIIDDLGTELFYCIDTSGTAPALAADVSICSAFEAGFAATDFIATDNSTGGTLPDLTVYEGTGNHGGTP